MVTFNSCFCKKFYIYFIHTSIFINIKCNTNIVQKDIYKKKDILLKKHEHIDKCVSNIIFYNNKVFFLQKNKDKKSIYLKSINIKNKKNDTNIVYKYKKEPKNLILHIENNKIIVLDFNSNLNYIYINWNLDVSNNFYKYDNEIILPIKGITISKEYIYIMHFRDICYEYKKPINSNFKYKSNNDKYMVESIFYQNPLINYITYNRPQVFNLDNYLYILSSDGVVNIFYNRKYLDKINFCSKNILKFQILNCENDQYILLSNEKSIGLFTIVGKLLWMQNIQNNQNAYMEKNQDLYNIYIYSNKNLIKIDLKTGQILDKTEILKKNNYKIYYFIFEKGLLIFFTDCGIFLFNKNGSFIRKIEHIINYELFVPKVIDQKIYYIYNNHIYILDMLLN